MFIVIADDITGAAEIAGIALRYGLNTVLTTDGTAALPNSEVAVVATNTRSDSEENAVKIVKEITKIAARNGNTLFKKTDSVLRGHIAAELRTIIDTTELTNALLIAQNPSKGRIIKNGTYYIKGERLSDTDFRHDPEFPALSSEVKDLLRSNVSTLSLDESSMPNDAICVADATDEDEIRLQLSKASNTTLLAGGADLFDILLQSRFGKTAKHDTETPKLPVVQRSIFICGSTQSKSITKEPYIKVAGSSEDLMPDDVFNGGTPDHWIDYLTAQYLKHKSLIIGIGQRENGGKVCALRLKTIMAEATLHLVNTAKPDLLIIEGGATAYSTLRRLNWGVFQLHREYAPGVVSMKHDNTEIVLKPGSYPWGKLFK